VERKSKVDRQQHKKRKKDQLSPPPKQRNAGTGGAETSASPKNQDRHCEGTNPTGGGGGTRFKIKARKKNPGPGRRDRQPREERKKPLLKWGGGDLEKSPKTWKKEQEPLLSGTLRIVYGWEKNSPKRN